MIVNFILYDHSFCPLMRLPCWRDGTSFTIRMEVFGLVASVRITREAECVENMLVLQISHVYSFCVTRFLFCIASYNASTSTDFIGCIAPGYTVYRTIITKCNYQKKDCCLCSQ